MVSVINIVWRTPDSCHHGGGISMMWAETLLKLTDVELVLKSTGTDNVAALSN